MAQRGYEHRVGIFRVDDDSPDVLRVLEADVFPRFTAINGLVHSIAIADVAANAGLSRACIDDVVVRIGHGDGADGSDILRIKKRLPIRARIGALPDASRNGAKIKYVRLAAYTGNRQHAPATKRTHLSPAHGA